MSQWLFWHKCSNRICKELFKWSEIWPIYGTDSWLRKECSFSIRYPPVRFWFVVILLGRFLICCKFSRTFLEFADIRTKQRISRAKTNVLVLPHYTDQDFTEIFRRQDDCDAQSHLILKQNDEISRKFTRSGMQRDAGRWLWGWRERWGRREERSGWPHCRAQVGRGGATATPSCRHCCVIDIQNLSIHVVVFWVISVPKLQTENSR